MENIYIFAIETSCDETSVAIIKNGQEIISSVVLSQMDIHKKFGGVVPEIASRNHIKNITLIFEECLEKAKMKMDNITAFAVTTGPGLIGSLLIGIQAAKILSFIYQKPLIPIHHIAGHIYANRLVGEFKFPLIVLVISGGHTELIYMEDHYLFRKIGETLDDAVGKCYDKVARVIGLSYPGGPEIDKLAQIGKSNYNLPLPLDDGSYNFSFSGLKSAVINLVHNEQQKGNEINKPNLATSFQNTVIDIISKKTMSAVEKYKVKQLLVAGGVAANSGIRERLENECSKRNIDFVIPPIKYCTDNAVMIGIAGYYAYQKGIRGDLLQKGQAHINL